MENFITKYGDEINGVFVGSNPQAFGAIDAIKAAGLEGDIKVITSSLFSDGYEYLKNDGKFYYGGALSSPPEMAKLVYETVINLSEGKEEQTEKNINITKLSAENVNEIEKPDWKNWP